MNKKSTLITLSHQLNRQLALIKLLHIAKKHSKYNNSTHLNVLIKHSLINAHRGLDYILNSHQQIDTQHLISLGCVFANDISMKYWYDTLQVRASVFSHEEHKHLKYFKSLYK